MDDTVHARRGLRVIRSVGRIQLGRQEGCPVLEDRSGCSGEVRIVERLALRISFRPSLLAEKRDPRLSTGRVRPNFRVKIGRKENLPNLDFLENKCRWLWEGARQKLQINLRL